MCDFIAVGFEANSGVCSWECSVDVFGSESWVDSEVDSDPPSGFISGAKIDLNVSDAEGTCSPVAPARAVSSSEVISSRTVLPSADLLISGLGGDSLIFSSSEVPLEPFEVLQEDVSGNSDSIVPPEIFSSKSVFCPEKAP